MPLQKWSENIWIAQMSAPPVFTEEIDTLSTQFGPASPAPHLGGDLSGGASLNSSNLSQLLRIRKLAADAGVGMRVSGPSDTVWTVFLTTGLDKVFAFTQDTVTALAQLQIQDETPPAAE